MANLSILLVDDDDDDRTLFTKAMSETNSSVHVATVEDGDKLMKELSSSAKLPDIIFLDFNMPLKNGLECLAEMSQSYDLSTVPVFIYSTSISPSAKEEAKRLGARGFIRKPDSFRMLKEILDKVIHLDFSKKEVADFNL